MSQHEQSPETPTERLTLTAGADRHRSTLHVDTTGETQWLLEDGSTILPDHVAELAMRLRDRAGAAVTLHVLDAGGEEDRRADVAEAAGFAVSATSVVVVHDLTTLSKGVGVEPDWSLADADALDADVAAALTAGAGEDEELRVVTDDSGPLGVLGWSTDAEGDSGAEGATADLTVVRVLPERSDVEVRRLYRHGLRLLADAGVGHALGTIDTTDQETLDAAQVAGGESVLVETTFDR